jgi:hypothetical protein
MGFEDIINKNEHSLGYNDAILSIQTIDIPEPITAVFIVLGVAMVLKKRKTKKMVPNSNKSHNKIIMAVICIMFILAQVPAVNANTMIFDDNYGEGWTAGNWDNYIASEYTYNQTQYSVSRVNEIKFKVTDTQGMIIAGDTIFQAYVNFLVDEETPGHSITNIKVSTTEGTLFEFDDRSTGWICYLDEIEYLDTAEVVFDTNPDTWQLFKIDLSQTDYFGWPYQSRELGITPITSITLSSNGNSIGNTQMLADNVMIIPEPATIVILGFAMMLLIFKKTVSKKKIIDSSR